MYRWRKIKYKKKYNMLKLILKKNCDNLTKWTENYLHISYILWKKLIIINKQIKNLYIIWKKYKSFQ